MKEDCIYKKYEPIFGSWYITKKVGEGAIARVYAMERRELGVTYHSALKALTIPLSEDEIKSAMADGMTGADLTHYYETIVQNVVNEFDLMSRLKGHSHIVSYEDHVIIEHEDDIGWDILMRIELLTPLIEHSLKHHLTEDDVLQLGIDLCKALEYCRRFDIIHRDVKPENIFVAPGGAYKLGDFGIAKIVEETRVGLSRKGTYTYMAPEVYKGSAYGPTADIYSLGLVMYKYLNDGRNPFMPPYPQQVGVDDYDAAFTQRISGAQIREPAYGSRRLKKLILKACSYDPKDRFRSATEFRQELEQLQRHQAPAKAGNAEKRAEAEDAAFGSAAVDADFGSSAVEASFGSSAGEGMLQPLDDPAEGRFMHKLPDPAARRKKAGRIALTIVLALFLIAGIVDAIIPDNITAITGVGASEEIYIGEQLAPDYVVEPDWFAGEPISFLVEDADIASVDPDGRITAHAVGETTMELSARDYTQRVEIEVVPKVTKISGVEKSLRLEEGSEQTLKPKLSPDRFADEPVSYKSSDESVVSVSGKGKLSAKSPGNAKVTISAGGCTKKVSVEVYEYVAPTVTYTYTNRSSGSGSSGSGKSSGSKKKKSGGYFNKSDDEYF
ncbi:MAG: serine/threonine protein kinase [Firmicutes bacterium]|nr:serine/threonine protein kinase [Bacillota bacterium]